MGRLLLTKGELVMTRQTKRKFALAALGAVIACALPLGTYAQTATPAEVKIAIVVPLSGPWTRQGELAMKGAKAAADDINAAGGIKALGGAKIKVLPVDTGDSVEKARSAAQRLVASEPDLVGASGSFLSSFTLAVTEVTERANVPFLTLSYADQITDRGFKYVFQTSPTGSAQASQTLPLMVKMYQSAKGKRPATMGILADNTAAPAAFIKPMREGGLAKEGLKLTMDEIFTPPLTDATSLIQKMRNARPDFIYMMPTNIPDARLLLEKMNEMGLGKGAVPLMTGGGHMVAPELVKVMDKSLLEGVMVTVANWAGKGHEELNARFTKNQDEPWMSQDSISTYGDVWILKDAMESAKSADRRQVASAIRSMNSTEGAAKFFPGAPLKFNEKGQRVGAETVVLQWRDGKPLVVYPESLAVTAPVWPKRR